MLTLLPSNFRIAGSTGKCYKQNKCRWKTGHDDI